MGADPEQEKAGGSYCGKYMICFKQSAAPTLIIPKMILQEDD